ncbi:MAG: hypothetical protein BRD55_11960 [Bacteroidetes bacterium SW_9_63_38]|nr:MAG: hypothetical protein BRD55_11960 [Bacteroidetes bacterium SW_9_63_38]
MDKKLVYSFAIFLLFTGAPIGVFLLSIVLYPGAEFTSYIADRFGYIILFLFVVTNSLIAGVFYLYSGQQSSGTSKSTR